MSLKITSSECMHTVLLLTHVLTLLGVWMLGMRRLYSYHLTVIVKRNLLIAGMVEAAFLQVPYMNLLPMLPDHFKTDIKQPLIARVSHIIIIECCCWPSQVVSLLSCFGIH